MLPAGDHPQEARRQTRSRASEIAAFVAGIGHRAAVSEGQVAAFAMAVFFNGMSRDEAVALTLAMRNSGGVLDWSDLPGPVTDKHSTGGVGDNVSLMLAPIVAACGAYVPMISGRGLGHTGGTLDKMDSIPGYVSQPDNALFRKTVLEAGCAIIGQTADSRPRRQALLRHPRRHRDGRIGAADHRLDPVEEAGRRAAVAGARREDRQRRLHGEEPRRGRALPRSLVEVANGAGLRTSALITGMNEPLASAAGNAVEVENAVDFLTGRRRDRRLEEVTLALAAEMLVSAGIAGSDQEGAGARPAALNGGAAAEVFGTHGAGARRTREFRRERRKISAQGAGRTGRRRPRGTALSPASPPATSALRSSRLAAAAPGRKTASTMRSASPGCCRSARRSSQGEALALVHARSETLRRSGRGGHPRGLYDRRKQAAGAEGGHQADRATRMMSAQLLHQQQRAVLDLVFRQALEEADADQRAVERLVVEHHGIDVLDRDAADLQPVDGGAGGSRLRRWRF